MVYDRTCRGGSWPLGLSHSWWWGARLYGALDRLDASYGAASWDEALAFLLRACEGRAVSEVQFWGHGKWGEARIAGDVLDERVLRAGHPLFSQWRRLATRFTPGALFWFRTCETFGASKGHSFASAFSSELGCAVAGHTYIIGPWQSGLHLLRPGASPHWSSDEGLKEGSPSSPRRALWSTPIAPNTITCFHGAVPESF
jgi:hypothetical protein